MLWNAHGYGHWRHVVYNLFYDYGMFTQKFLDHKHEFFLGGGFVFPNRGREVARPKGVVTIFNLTILSWKRDLYAGVVIANAS